MITTRAIPLRSIGQSYRRLFPYARPHGRSFLVAGLATLLLVAVELARPWPIKVVIDQVILGQDWSALPESLAGEANRMRLLAVACISVLVLAAFAGLLSYTSKIWLARAGHEVVANVRRDVLKKLLRLPLPFHDGARKGDLMVRLTGDAAAMSTLLVEGIFAVGQELLMLVGVLIITLTFEFELALIAAVTIPTVLWMIRHYGSKIRRAVQQQRKREGAIGNHANSSLAGISVIQAFGLERTMSDQFRRDAKRSQRAGIRAARLEGSLGRWVEFAIAVGTALLLWLGSQRVLAGHLSAGELIVLISYVRALYKPLRKLSTRSTKIAKSAASAERLLEVFDAGEQLPTVVPAKRLREVQGELTFENVSYAYRPDEPALRDVDLRIAAGERIALVGPNGAGKSTLVTMIPRLRDPDEGTVRLDGIDLRSVDLDDLRRQVALVFQDTVLFDGSLGDNVRYGDREATDDQFRYAIELSGVAALAARLPQGLETPVGEEGLALSGGQRQAVALARALLRNARVLVLDEPSRSLDPDAARRFHETLLPALRGHTVIVITHDVENIESFDRVVKLVGGRLDSSSSFVQPVKLPESAQS